MSNVSPHSGHHERKLLLRASGFRARFWLTFLISLACHSGTPGSTLQSGKNILVIFSSVKGDNSQEILNDYEATLHARVPGPITIYDEYLVWKLDSEGRGPYLESVS